MHAVTPFDHSTYREFLRERLAAMPKGGHGQLARIAKHLNVHPTLITQIVRGQKNLSLEHALLIAEYLGLGEAETEFFMCLIELERAGHFKLKSRIERKLAQLKAQNSEAQGRVPQHKVLPEAERAIFYSQWFYSAVRLLAGTKGYDSIDEIAEELSLPRKTAKEALDFLLAHGLLKREGKKLSLGPQRTYLPGSSTLVARHHSNWRLKAVENYQNLGEAELAFTAPISLSHRDFSAAKKILLRAIEEISALVDKSPEETVGCLNIDLFLLGKK